MNNKDNFYDTIADKFSVYKNQYDTNRRKEVLIDEFLSQIEIKNKRILDCGCGDGFFISEIVKTYNNINISGCDISLNLLNIAKQKNKKINFFQHNIFLKRTPETFDIIISSEVIEHSANPKKALENLCNSISENGYLILSTPNKLWEGIVKVSSFFKLRPFQGYENFLTIKEIRSILNKNNFKIINYKGIHLYPFQFGFNKLHRYLDERSKFLSNLKINYAIIAKKN